jgi:hypothetical protein
MSSLWDRFQQYFLRHEALGFTLDISRMKFADDFLPRLEPEAQRAFQEMPRPRSSSSTSGHGCSRAQTINAFRPRV